MRPGHAVVAHRLGQRISALGLRPGLAWRTSFSSKTPLSLFNGKALSFALENFRNLRPFPD
jgi:hypothetical protein